MPPEVGTICCNFVPSASARMGRALQLGQTWEVANLENTLGKLSLGETPFVKVPNIVLI